MLALGVLFVAGLAGLALLFGSWKRPDVGLAAWVVATCLVPCWFDLRLPLFGLLEPATMVGLVVAIGALLNREAAFRIVTFDLGVAAMVAIGFASIHYGTPASYAKQVLLLWALSYGLGRLAHRHGTRIGRVVAALGAALGCLSVVELLSNVHVFQHLTTSSPLSFWADIQYRGGFARSELAFGHSIALGAFLAATIPFVLLHFRSAARTLSLIAVFAGVICTLSRGAILAAALITALCCFPGRGLALRSSQKTATWVTIGLAGLAASPFALHISDVGSADIAGSTQGRYNLLPLIETTHSLGLATGASLDPTSGGYNFSGRFTVDSTYLDVGVTAGYLIAGILMIGTLWFVLRYLKNPRSGPASIVIVGELPIFLTVALITQWAALAWFVAGWAVSEGSHQRAERSHIGRGTRTRSTEHVGRILAESTTRRYAEERCAPQMVKTRISDS